MKLVDDIVKLLIINITITKVNDVFFLHRDDTGEFLAQGKNHAEIKKILENRFPGQTFMATPENMKLVGYELDDTV